VRGRSRSGGRSRHDRVDFDAEFYAKLVAEFRDV